MLVQKWHFIGSIVAGLVSMAATVSVPIMLGGGIDAVADGDTPRRSSPACSGSPSSGSFGFTYRFGLFRSALRIEKDLRNLMYERLTELFDFWDRTQSGQVISRANTDIRSIQLLFAFGPLVAMQVVLFFFAVVVMLTVDITLTLVAIAPLPFVYAIGVRLRNRVPVAVGGHGAQAEMATIVDENIQGIRVVKAFNQESAQVQNLARATCRLRWAGTAVADTAPATHRAWNHCLVSASHSCCSTAACRPSTVNSPSATSSPSPPMSSCSPRHSDCWASSSSSGSAPRAAIRCSTSSTRPRRSSSPTTPSPFPTRPAASSSTTSTSATPWVGEPAPRVHRHDRTGRVRRHRRRHWKRQVHDRPAHPRFYDVDSGSVRADGHDVRTLALGDLRRSAATVTDDPFLFAHLVHDNVAFARPDASDGEVQAALADAAASDFVSDLEHGSHTEVGERGLTLSGGQRQRLAIARTLLADPQILILDDATSAIDVAVEERIHAALDARRRPHHDPDRPPALHHRPRRPGDPADNGAVAATGTHDELLTTNPRYAAILADTVGEDTEQGDA